MTINSYSIVILSRALCVGWLGCVMSLWAAEPLALSSFYWKDPAFLKAFNGSYRIEARIEPSLSTAERGVLVQLQELMAQGKRDGAIALLQGSELTTNSAALTYNLANVLMESGESAKAIAAYQKSIKAYPSFRRAHRNLGLAHVREEQWDEALTHLSEAVRLGDSEGMTYGLLGYCRLAREQYASALQAYRLAQLTEPEVAEWSAGIAQCLQQLDQREEALALLDEVIRMRPMEASYAVLKANIHMQLDQREAASKTLELPHRLGILSPDSIMLLTELHLRGDRVSEAIRVLDSAFADGKRPSENAVIRLLQVAVAGEQWTFAKYLIDRDPAKKPSRAMRLAKAKYLIASEVDSIGGGKTLLELTQEDPTDGEALLAWANYQWDASQYDVAELIYERAAADEAHAFAAYSALTRMQASRERYAEALKAVEKALAIRPDEGLEQYRKALQQALEATR